MSISAVCDSLQHATQKDLHQHHLVLLLAIISYFYAKNDIIPLKKKDSHNIHEKKSRLCSSFFHLKLFAGYFYELNCSRPPIPHLVGAAVSLKGADEILIIKAD